MQKAVLVILWMAMLGSEVTHTFSKTFAEAVVDGGNLVLSSGARVTQMTHQTVLGQWKAYLR